MRALAIRYLASLLILAHSDIDLLKCRSFAVVHTFTDAQVLDPEWKTILCEIVRIAKPFVHRCGFSACVAAIY